MGPRLKKSRISETASSTDDTSGTAKESQKDGGPANGTSNQATKPPGNAIARVDTGKARATEGTGHLSSTSDQASSRNSWYGGSWRSKASPVAEVARESISVAKGATSESSAEDSSQSSGQYMHSSLKRPRKSIPLVAEETRVNASGSNTEAGKSKEKTPENKNAMDQTENTEKVGSREVAAGVTEPPLPPEPDKATFMDETQRSKHIRNSSAWFGWWSRPDGYPPSEAGDARDGQKPDESAPTDAQATPLPLSPQTTRDDVAKITTEAPGSNDSEQQAKGVPADDQGVAAGSSEAPQSRSWFGLWSASQNEQAQQKPASTPPRQEPDAMSPASGSAHHSKEPSLQPPQLPAGNETAESDALQNKSSGWAFWSRDTSKAEADGAEGTQKHLGELAVADTPSQSHPEVAQFNEAHEQNSNSKSKSNSPANPSSIKETKTGKTTTIRDDSAFATNAEVPPPASPASAPADKTEATKSSAASKQIKKDQARPNLILPEFHKTFPTAYMPSYWERLGQYLASSLRIADYSLTTPNHVAITPSLPKVKNAVAIGIHGYFPAPLIQRVLGQPTGTSIRFANYAASTIRSWTEQNQPETSCEIEQVALEGEGFIADRVATLWKLLLNWLSQLRNADLILIAAHSQGVPVAIMLVAKLFQLGCLSANAKVGICAMAGVNLGPFGDYKSKIYGGAAVELFEFGRSDSKVSREYASSLEVVLRHGVRITYIGSIDDQLVSLESSLFANLTHPYVQRAVFVDGRLHAPDFITHLVGFALKLRNLGISDHGLIRELSLPLAGSIYGGEGHSRVYDDDAVYRLALDFALETTDIDPQTYIRPTGEVASPDSERSSSERRRSQGGIPNSTVIANSIRRGSLSAAVLPGVAPQIAPYETPVTGGNANPYFLPWAMRGILEEERVKKEMQGEVKELIRLFDDWKPVTKPLKDVKFRLEAVKSKL